jgi:hypothetical protein
MSRDVDETITLKKIDERVYSLDPFPFASDRLRLVSRGRYVAPFPEDFPPERVGASLYVLPADRQSYSLWRSDKASIARPPSVQPTRRSPRLQPGLPFCRSCLRRDQKLEQQLGRLWTCCGFAQPRRDGREFLDVRGQGP